MIWTDLAFGPCYMGLNLDVIVLESGLQFNLFFSLLGHNLGRELGLNLAGLNETHKARGASLGGHKKPIY